MRLLLLTQDFPPEVGGIQTYAAELAARLSDRCEHFAVLAPRRPGSRRIDRACGYPVHRLPSRPDLLPLAALPVLPFLLRRDRFDVTFHAQWQTAAAALLSRTLTGFPRRITVAAHGRELLFNPFRFPALRRAYGRLRRAVLQRADHLFPVSRFTAGLLQDLGVPPERITVVSNGTDPHHFRPVDASSLRRTLGLEGRPALLSVGRLVPRKGIDAVVQILPTLLDAFPDLIYLVVGTGPDRPRLEALVAQHGLQEHVRFLGTVPYAELPAYYSLCDVFVLPSREAPPDVEGFGIVFLEASACGVPVVGARSGGIPDAVREGETGLLVSPGDPASLAAALQHLLTAPAFARRLGRQGRAYVEETATWDHAADRLYAALGACC